ncbi:MAG: sugar phosphate isomerase/epimerase [Pirellulales bacterium]|nr:sugar phosphate isomerase/epimerase [Pirellulales bacterium]
MPASNSPRVILSAFADEAANQKTAVQQFSALAALGLQYYSIRFIDVGGGIKNVMQLTKSEISDIRHLQDEYGLNVASLGSPLGKVKLVDIDDGTSNQFVPFKKYLDREVKKACELAHAFETKLIRGFSFYPPQSSDPHEFLPQAVDQIGQITEACHRSDLTLGLEIEANLVGCTGELMAEIHRQVNHPGLMLVFDAANIVVQGFGGDEILSQFRAMKPGLGWMHVKDYKHPSPASPTRNVDEEALKHFVPAGDGDGAHELVFRELRAMLPELETALRRRGIPGVFVDLEPHVKGGGQFGGFSGPDGLGVALRSVCRVLDYTGVDYHLRDFEDVKAARGF